VFPAPSPFAVAADLLWPDPNPYLNDPAGWANDRLGEFWWSGQREMAEMVVRNRYSAIKASQDVSKSHTMSRLACWWIDVHPPGKAFVVTTAPTTARVEAILWRYIGGAHRTGNLPGRVTLDAKWYIGQELVARPLRAGDHRRGRLRSEEHLRRGRRLGHERACPRCCGR